METQHWTFNSENRHDCLVNGLLRRRSKKTSKLRVTGLCEGNSPVTQWTSNAENVPIWWRHHMSPLLWYSQGFGCFRCIIGPCQLDRKTHNIIYIYHLYRFYVKRIGWLKQGKPTHSDGMQSIIDSDRAELRFIISHATFRSISLKVHHFGKNPELFGLSVIPDISYGKW